MTAKELKEQISILQGQLDFLSRKLADLETKEKIKRKIKDLFVLLKNMAVEFIPLGLFLLFVASLYFLLNISWKEFTELLRILIWPVTVLIILFSSKKVFTYLFLSMEELNLFTAKGKFKNVQDVIRERAEELQEKERAEEKQREKIKIQTIEIEKMSSLIQQKDKSLEKGYGIAQKATNALKKLNEDYKKLGEKYVKKLQKEIVVKAKRRPREILRKPYYQNNPMVWSETKKKWYVIDESGNWLEFVAKESDIEWRIIK